MEKLKPYKHLELLNVIRRKSPVLKKGTTGQQLDFKTNYVRLKSNGIFIYQYVVHFDPPVDAINTRLRLVKSLRNIVGDVRLFDGSILYLPIQIQGVN
jgi:aubergine